MKSGQEPALAAAILKAVALSACLPFPGPLRAVLTAFQAQLCPRVPLDLGLIAKYLWALILTSVTEKSLFKSL